MNFSYVYAFAGRTESGHPLRRYTRFDHDRRVARDNRERLR